MLRKLALLAGSGLLLTGCASTFPERLGWEGNDPTLYALAFQAAGSEAIFREATGDSYYGYFGDAAYSARGDDLCDDRSLALYLRDKSSLCDVVRRAPVDGCRDVDLCMRFVAHPDLLRRAALREGMSNPCKSLTRPSGLKYAMHTSGIGMSAQANWRILQCGGKQVSATRFEVEPDGSHFRVHFHLGGK